MICKNCMCEFTPSKNDSRIKFCSDKCRIEYRKNNNYNKNYYKENKDKFEEYRKREDVIERKNKQRREKYLKDKEYREKIKNNVKQYRINNPQKKLENDLKIKYGITIEDYIELLEKQDYKCAICGTTK